MTKPSTQHSAGILITAYSSFTAGELVADYATSTCIDNPHSMPLSSRPVRALAFKSIS